MSSKKKLQSLLIQYLHSNQNKPQNATTTNNNNDPPLLLSPILQEMENQQATLQDVLELLENELTGNNDEIRGIATSLLTACLSHQHYLTLSAQELHLFIIFFCRRLQDFPSCDACLKGIYIILQKYSSQLDPKLLDVIDILQSLTREIHIPSYSQAIRYQAFEILDYLFTPPPPSSTFTAGKGGEEEEGRGEKGKEEREEEEDVVGKVLSQEDDNITEYVTGIIYAMEGEKDPRCLLLDLKVLFKMTKKFQTVFTEKYSPFQPQSSYASKLITKMDVINSDEEERGEGEEENMTIAQYLFENISCYFPISFIPPPDDPYGITPERLSEALFDAMFAIPAITTLSIPFLLEQLINNDSEKGRIEALLYLIQIIQRDGYSVLLLPDQPKPEKEELLKEEHDAVKEEGVSFYYTPGDEDDHAHIHHSHQAAAVIAPSQTPVKRKSCGHHHEGGGSCGGHDHDHDHDDHSSILYSQLPTLEKISHLIYDILISEGSNFILQKTNELLSVITFSISKALNQKQSTITKTTNTTAATTADVRTAEMEVKHHWQIFVGNLIQKAKLEIFLTSDQQQQQSIPYLTGNNHAIDSLKGRNAWKVVLFLGQSGGIYANTAVISTFLPIIFPFVQSTLIKVKKQFQQQITYRYQGIYVLLTAPMFEKDQERVLPLIVFMLENLITLALPEVMDVSEFHDLSFFLQNQYHRQIFELFASFLLTPIIVDTTTIVKIKDETSNNTEEEKTNSKRTVDGDVLLCYLFVIKSLKELLKRLKGKNLPEEQVRELLTRLCEVYQEGINVFVRIGPSSSSSSTGPGSDVIPLSHYFLVEKEDDQLSKELLELFVTVAQLEGAKTKDPVAVIGSKGAAESYFQLLVPDLLPKMLAQLSSNTDHSAKETIRKQKILVLLSSMIQKSDSILLLQNIFEQVQQRLFTDQRSSNIITSDGVSLAVEMETIGEVIQLFASIMKKIKVSTADSAKKKANCFIGITGVKQTASEGEKRSLIENSILIAITSTLIHFNSITGANNSNITAAIVGTTATGSALSQLNGEFFQLMEDCFYYYTTDIQTIVFDILHKRLLHSAENTNNAVSVSQEWRLQLYYHSLVYLDKSSPLFSSTSSSDGGGSAGWDVPNSLQQLLSTYHDVGIEDPHRLTVIYSIAIIVNKVQAAVALHDLLREVFLSFQRKVIAREGLEKADLYLYVWILKALLLRVAPVALPEGSGEPLTIQAEATAKASAPPTTWQDLYLRQFLQFILPAASSSSRNSLATSSVFIEQSAELYRILLHHHQQQSGTTSNEPSSQKKDNDLPELNKILTKESRGQYSLFWIQKLFSQLIYYFSVAFTSHHSIESNTLPLPPSSTSTATAASISVVSSSSFSISSSSPSTVVHFFQKLPLYILYCQCIQQVALSIRQSSQEDLFQYLLLIFSELQTIEQQSSSSSQQSQLYQLEKELFPAMEILLKENPLPFCQSLQIIIPRLIKVAQQGKEAKVRALAIESLQTLPKYISQYSTLHPYRKRVIDGLLKVLDDPKRAVRQLAVKVRNEWILMKTNE